MRKLDSWFGETTSDSDNRLVAVRYPTRARLEAAFFKLLTLLPQLKVKRISSVNTSTCMSEAPCPNFNQPGRTCALLLVDTYPVPTCTAPPAARFAWRAAGPILSTALGNHYCAVIAPGSARASPRLILPG